MKTKEEIETICSNIIDSESVNEKFKQAVYEGAILGYTQCQEDNKDKKYTEEDIRKAIQVGISAEAGDYPEGFTYKLGITLEDYFIWCIKFKDKQD